jgi:uncharacterized membrane protein YgdD (TMEM256/DUF423 family)
MRVWSRALGAIAGLMGAAGVALAAVGAHRSGNPNVTTAAYFLLLHAAAIIALGARSPSRGWGALLAAASLLALGAVLFSGELAVHALAEITVLPLAAPTGGLLMILGWLVAALALPASSGESAKGL